MVGLERTVDIDSWGGARRLRKTRRATLA